MPFCLECKNALIGRSDKKFCSDHCRSQYHNRINSDKKRFINKINAILRKNRTILKELLSNGLEEVDKSILIKQGFNFDFCTAHDCSIDAYWHYEFGLIKGENSQYKIIHKAI